MLSGYFHELIGGPKASVIARVFDLMAFAEQAIEDAKRANPQWTPSKTLFSALMPPPNFTLYADSVYEAHAAEIVRRDVEGAPFTEPTRAECLVAILAASGQSPLKTHFADAATLLHSEIFATRPVADADELSLLRSRPGVLEAIEETRDAVAKMKHVVERGVVKP